MPYFSVQYRDRYAAHQDHWFPGTYDAFEADDLAAAAVLAAKAKPGVEVYSVTRVFWDKKYFESRNDPPKPRELKNPPLDGKGKPIRWEDNNGRVVCLSHAGMTLKAAIEAHPKARRHDTEIGTYWRVPSNESYGCESCDADRRFNAKLAKTG